MFPKDLNMGNFYYKVREKNNRESIFSVLNENNITEFKGKKALFGI